MFSRLFYAFCFFTVLDAVMEMFRIRADQFSEKHPGFDRIIVKVCFHVLSLFAFAGLILSYYFLLLEMG